MRAGAAQAQDAGFALPPTPKFGRTGIQRNEVLVFHPLVFDMLAVHYRREVEAFVLFFHRLESVLADLPAAKKPVAATTTVPATSHRVSIREPSDHGSSTPAAARSRFQPTVEEVPNEDDDTLSYVEPPERAIPTSANPGLAHLETDDPYSGGQSRGQIRPQTQAEGHPNVERRRIHLGTVDSEG